MESSDDGIKIECKDLSKDLWCNHDNKGLLGIRMSNQATCLVVVTEVRDWLNGKIPLSEVITEWIEGLNIVFLSLGNLKSKSLKLWGEAIKAVFIALSSKGLKSIFLWRSL